MSDGERRGRIVFRNTEDEHQEIGIDLILTAISPSAASIIVGSGRTGHEDFRCPFTLSTDGHVDFGSGYDDPNRYYQTDMMEKALSIGKRITWSGGEDTWEYAVVSMAPLI